MEEYIRLTEQYRDQRLTKVPEEVRDALRFARAQVKQFRKQQAKQGIRNPRAPRSDEERHQRHLESARRYYEENKDKADTAKRRYVKQNPEKVAQAKARYAAENPDTILKTKRTHHISKTYGITYDTWLSIIEDQGYRCKICAVTLDPANWATDHCHTTGEVRGILCLHCNWGLGQFRDDPNRLISAIGYLTSSEDHSGFRPSDSKSKLHLGYDEN